MAQFITEALFVGGLEQTGAKVAVDFDRGADVFGNGVVRRPEKFEDAMNSASSVISGVIFEKSLISLFSSRNLRDSVSPR